MELKIGDFGLATKLEFEGDRRRTICGTPNYIAPEILDGKQGHSYEVDIWSFGVILYTLIIGKPPFETSDVKTTYRRIKMNAYSFPEHVIISEHAKDIITKILNLDPAKRPTLDDLYDHPFFRNGASVPKLLPASTLACPPSASYVKQFTQNLATVETFKTDKPRLESTAPIKPGTLSKEVKATAPNLLVTDRVSVKTTAPPGSSSMSPRPTVTEEKKETAKKSGAAPAIIGAPVGSSSIQGSAVWVKKWVDYSSKYGLGYLLSNGATGVFFNDSTKIILDSKGQ